MSLDTMLAAHDQAALEALASKGLVRRAAKDFEGGLASVLERADDRAVLDVGGETVEMTAMGPAQAICTCSAVGVCRHILMAVFALQSVGPGVGGDVPEAPQLATKDVDAHAEILTLQVSDIEAFARTDMTRAIELASQDNAQIDKDGASCTVTLEDGAACITFIAGLGLKGAAFKGPKTKARLLVAAAALIVRRSDGLTLPEITDREGRATPQLTPDYLEDAQKRLEKAVRGTLSGVSQLASDMLFDLAISARAEAAPRLTAQLRGLARQARIAPTRHVNFLPERFLADAARAYALMEALKTHPGDPELTGALKRSYQDAPAMGLLMLGATRWTTPSGARGVTAYGLDPERHVWHSVTHARAAGMDPAFDPAWAYHQSLWNVASMQGLMGKRVHLTAPRIEPKGAIAADLASPAVPGSKLHNLKSGIPESDLYSHWPELFADLSDRFGNGLRRGATPQPILIAPQRYGGLNFNDLKQVYEWEAFDREGNALMLQLPVQYERPRQIEALGPISGAALIEARFGGEDLELVPVSVIIDTPQGCLVHNLTLDPPPRIERSVASAAWNAIRSLTRDASASQSPRIVSLETFFSRVLDYAVAIMRNVPHAPLDGLVRESEARGLTLLSALLKKSDTDVSPGTALRITYVVEELRRQWPRHLPRP